ncbi:hypothetical protein IC619_015305 [Hazenella sp. IB182353]|uniref:hypothetical protein n=1 Tax=Polycladospora coralii TaxID=2771432 RepID=UPI001746FE3D|nr:hypothetical protein [Polycladospora coralii]MBS7531839.1 hypothetical protein [Polycladospora coralii]
MENKKRGILLTIVLWLMMISYSIGLFVFITLLIMNEPLPLEFHSKYAELIFYWVSPIIVIFSLIVSIGMYCWKRWAVYAYFTIQFIGLIIALSLYFMHDALPNFGDLIGAIIIFFLIKRKWQYFE